VADPRMGGRAQVRPGACAGMSRKPSSARSPAPAAAAADAAASASAPAAVDPSSADILLVDDRPENLLALEAILTGVGGKHVKANSGMEALKQLLAQDFAVILLDVQMPGMDGFETTTFIRQRDRSPPTPIIFSPPFAR